MPTTSQLVRKIQLYLFFNAMWKFAIFDFYTLISNNAAYIRCYGVCSRGSCSGVLFIYGDVVFPTYYCCLLSMYVCQTQSKYIIFLFKLNDLYV